MSHRVALRLISSAQAMRCEKRGQMDASYQCGLGWEVSWSQSVAGEILWGGVMGGVEDGDEDEDSQCMKFE